MSTHRQKLYERCRERIQQRTEGIRKEMAMLHASAEEETKSSAGDKYETGRAMVQLEMEKLNEQLSEASRQQQVMDKINPLMVSVNAQPGSIVRTSQGNFYLAVSLGAVEVEGEKFMVVSLASPVGAKLNNLRKGDSFPFNNREYVVHDVE